MNEQIAELIPLFVMESHGRLERLLGLAPRVVAEAEAVTETRRELHTLRGSCRLLELREMAELCLAGEELLDSAPPDLRPRLEEILCRFGALLDEAATGWGISIRELEQR